MIRIISIGTDRNLFDAESAVSKRMIEYGALFGEVHVIVFTLLTQKLETIQLAPNVIVYPTQSTSRLRYIADALAIGKDIGKRIYFGETVISSQDPFETGVVGALLKKPLKASLQIQIHTDFFSKGFYDGTLLNWARFEISRFIIKKGDAFRVVREKIATDLRDHFGIKSSRISVLPIWVDITGIQQKIPTVNLHQKYPIFNKIVLCASRLTEEKRIDLIIRAFAKASEKFPAAGLVILGKGPLKLSLQKLAQKLGVKERVMFEDWQQDPVSYMKTADLFVNASRFEGYGMSLVEAAAAGCPMLTTNVGVVQDLFEDGREAYICNNGDERCFTNKLISFLENPSFQAGVAKGASLKVQQLAISKEEYLKKYKEAIELTLLK